MHFNFGDYQQSRHVIDTDGRNKKNQPIDQTDAKCMEVVVMISDDSEIQTDAVCVLIFKEYLTTWTTARGQSRTVI